MTTFDEARAQAVESIALLGLGEEALVGMRRLADETIAELIADGFPRAAAGAVTMTSIAKALNSQPHFNRIRLEHLLRSLGAPDAIPIELTTALLIVLSTVAPDPEFADGPS